MRDLEVLWIVLVIYQQVWIYRLQRSLKQSDSAINFNSESNFRRLEQLNTRIQKLEEAHCTGGDHET